MRLAAALLSIAAVAACSGGGGGLAEEAASQPTDGASTDEDAPPFEPEVASPGTSQTDACSLLTDEEIASALDSPVTRRGGDDNDCDWELQRDDIFVVSLHVYGTGSDGRLLFEAGRRPTDEPIPGIGDDAYLGIARSVNVLVGELSFALQITPDCGLGTTVDCEPLDVEAVARGTELAGLVAGRI